jgi:predicted nucleic acid-binding protein
VAIGESEKVIAVADASFLIGLCLISQWRLLTQVVERLYIAPAVWEEVVVRGQDRPGAQEMGQAGFIEKRPVKNRQSVEMLKVFLGTGEAESLVLAQEVGCSVVFVDDLKARKAAQEAGFQIVGVAGFLLTSKQKGIIQEIRPLLETLQQRGFRLSRTLVETVLREAGEVDPSS